jgi:hypothetical protein
MGAYAGYQSQGAASVAIGEQSGSINQGLRAVAIGRYTAYNHQRDYSVAIGEQCGNKNQGTGAVAIGWVAGYDTQGYYSVAIGNGAGQEYQGNTAVAIGNYAGYTGQGTFAIAIGNKAGYTGQGTNAIAIGYNAGVAGQSPYSIVLNASSRIDVNAGTTGFFVNPIRNLSLGGTTVVHYDATTSELSYGTTSSDYRIKENVMPLNNTFRVDYLNPVTYINKQTNKQEIGVIAHELQEYYPELVTGVKDGPELQGVDYIGLIPILINEIKNLKNEMKTLKGKLEDKGIL